MFEQHGARRKSTDFRKGKRWGTNNHLIVYNKPRKRPEWMTEAAYQSAPDTLTVRELKTDRKILVTTLSCCQYAPKAALKALYKDRWHIELDLRNLKTTMSLETLSCKTPDIAEKERWIYLLAYNLIRLVMAQSALLLDLLPRKMSFKHTLQIWLAYRIYHCVQDGDILTGLCLIVAQKRVGNRPG